MTHMLTHLELAGFCRRLTLLLKAGISVYESLPVMEEDAADSDEQEILRLLQKTFRETGNLSSALEQTGLFPVYMVRMIGIGEETGRLDQVTEALSLYYEQEEERRETLHHAVTYPLVILLLMIAVMGILLTQVMPVFGQVYRQLGTEMTGPASLLLSAGTLLNRLGSGLLIGLGLLVLLLWLYGKSPAGRGRMAAALQKRPPLAQIARLTETSRFAGVMALTLSSGLTPEQGLELVLPLIRRPELRKKLESVQQQTAAGEDFSKALHQAKIFDAASTRLLHIGQITGQPETTLRQIASQLEEQAESRISRLLGLLEPGIILILSLLAALILLSVMLPLLGILSSM